MKQKYGAKAENDLALYCTREGIPFVLFEEFDGALKVRRNVVCSSAYLFPKSDPNIFDEPQVSAGLLT